MGSQSQINSSVVQSVPVSVVDTHLGAGGQAKDEPVHKNMFSTRKCAPSVFDAMILGLQCGPAEADHLFVVPIRHQDEVAGRGFESFQSASFDGTLTKHDY